MLKIEENVKNLLKEIPQTNPFGEKVTLVAAVKLQSPNDINRAISAGIKDIGDNHVQEFRDKFTEISEARGPDEAKAVIAACLDKYLNDFCKA